MCVCVCLCTKSIEAHTSKQLLRNSFFFISRKMCSKMYGKKLTAANFEPVLYFHIYYFVLENRLVFSFILTYFTFYKIFISHPLVFLFRDGEFRIGIRSTNNSVYELKFSF